MKKLLNKKGLRELVSSKIMLILMCLFLVSFVSASFNNNDPMCNDGKCEEGEKWNCDCVGEECDAGCYIVCPQDCSECDEVNFPREESSDCKITPKYENECVVEYIVDCPESSCGDGVCQPNEKECPLGAPCTAIERNPCPEDCEKKVECEVPTVNSGCDLIKKGIDNNGCPEYAVKCEEKVICPDIAYARPGPNCDGFPIKDKNGCIVSYRFECHNCPDTSYRPEKEGCKIKVYEENGCEMYKYECEEKPVCPAFSLTPPREGCEYKFSKNSMGCKVPEIVCEKNQYCVDGCDVRYEGECEPCEGGKATTIVLRNPEEKGSEVEVYKGLPPQASEIAIKNRMKNLKVILDHINERAVYKVSGTVNYRPWWALFLIELEKNYSVTVDAKTGEEIET